MSDRPKQPISPSTHDHRREAEQIGPISSSVIVVSDSRTEKTDRSGRTASALIRKGGHNVVHEALIRNDGPAIRTAIQEALEAGSRFVFCTGGTGLGDRDWTVTANGFVE